MARKKSNEEEVEAEETEQQQPSQGKRMFKFGLWLVIIAMIWLASNALSERYQAQVINSKKAYNLVLNPLPNWFPDGYRGRLAELITVPRTISMVSSTWSDQLREAISANPWVLKLHHLARKDTEILFQADLRRPSVGIKCKGGYLLVDGKGVVIDFQQGSSLSSQWRMPRYRPREGEIPRQKSGSRFVGAEFEELFDLVALLWQADVYPRWSSDLPELSSHSVQGESNRFWVLQTVGGSQWEWGWAPGYERIEAVSSGSKLKKLEVILKRGLAHHASSAVRL